MDRCVLKEWVVRGGGLDGYFGEQELPAGIKECLERFHGRCVNYLSRQCVLKWGSRMVKANWRWRVQHRCWWNLNVWPRSPWRVG